MGGVFDGHCGRGTAAYAADRMPFVLQQQLLQRLNVEEQCDGECKRLACARAAVSVRYVGKLREAAREGEPSQSVCYPSTMMAAFPHEFARAR